MQQIKKIIATICDSFTLNKSNNIIFNNSIIENLNDSENNKKRIVQKISTTIYNNFYCASAKVETPEKTIHQQPGEVFAQSLLHAYNPAPSLSKGWKKIEKERNGITYLQKQNEVIRLYPGQFMCEYDQKENSYGLSDYYSILNPPLNLNSNGYFHYIHGSAPHMGSEHPLIRFYFHTHPDGAPLLIKLISANFNRFRVPFTFKCCANKKDYTRTDSAVLYLAHHFFSISIQLLEKIIPQIRSFLKKETPLFTLRICDGFSFAENPFNNNLSFGQSRSNLIAEGVYEFFTNKNNSDKMIDYVLEKIKKAGYDFNALHLNPASTFPYDFTLATFQ